ncbi:MULTISPECIES: methylation-associated defense system protein MAD4 [Thermus]|uniref:methylation-associated defense system protein MAD4 n=1 Tax=Thermus TaxID=270 RepID=UPI001F220E8B|nr:MULTISPECIES: hypothetical protein [Thermus]
MVLVADKNMEAVVRTLLEKRYPALQICPVQVDIFVHPRRDPGVLREAEKFLSPFSEEYRYALVIFDYEGCGQEQDPPEKLETDLKSRLEQSGWQERCEVIILVPELEVWVWSNSPHVPQVLGLTQQQVNQVLIGFPRNKLGKPERPKEAMEKCLHLSKLPRSSSIYAELAGSVSFQHCADPSFNKLRVALRKWFPPSRST